MSDGNSLVDALGIEVNLAQDDILIGGCLVLKVMEPDGTVRLSTRWSDGISWLEKAGMLRYAEKYETQWIEGHDDDC